MAHKHPNAKDKKRWLILAGILVLALLAVLLLVRNHGGHPGIPTLTVETPQKISLSETDALTLDVTISDLGEACYPAASMSISFDSSRLEFLGVTEGNVFISGEENAAGVAQKLPDWSCNTDASNETGFINIMYLDLTGGKYAFSRELLAEDHHVVLRLNFRLRGSVQPNDVLDLIVEDAVFAASDESQSLATAADTLQVKNSKIVVGE